MTALLYLAKRGPNRELRYSLRSVAANLPHDEVWIAGRKPEWLHPDVRVIPTPDRGPKWTRIVEALETACRGNAVPSDLVYLNDDMFLMDLMATVPTLHRGALQEQRGYGTRTGHSGGIAETERLMRGIGLDGDLLSYELHVPLPFQRELMAESLATARRRAPGIRCLHYRTLYGNMWEVGGARIADVKVHGKEAPPDGPLLSTSDGAFSQGAAGRLVRDRFPDPGPYEK